METKLDQHVLNLDDEDWTKLFRFCVDNYYMLEKYPNLRVILSKLADIAAIYSCDEGAED